MSADLIAPLKKLRRKSTERSPRPITLTEGDADIIRHVAKHRFLRSPDIARLTGRPLEKVRERANELYHSAHLDRPIVQAEEILARAPETTRRAANPWKLTAAIVDATGRIEIGNIPDKVFGLDNTQARKRSYFLYEADCGTMPITRTHPRQTSFQQKVLGYLAGGGSDNAHGKRFGIGNFRVLTVTTSPQRVETMIDAVKAATGGAGSRQFLFGVHSDIVAPPNLLQHEWITGAGERVRLFD